MTEISLQLLVLDSGPSSAAPGLLDLLDIDTVRFRRLAVIDPLETLNGPARHHSIAQRAQAAIAGLDGLDLETSLPLVVVAHCANAEFASALCPALTAAGWTVRRLVLAAPWRVTLPLIRANVTNLLLTLGDTAAEAVGTAEEIWSDGTDPETARDATRLVLRERACRQAGPMGFDEQETEEFAEVLCGRYETWIDHLVSTFISPPAGSGVAVEVFTDDSDEWDQIAARITMTGSVRVHRVPDPSAFADSTLRARFLDLLTEASGEEARHAVG